jgi:hypothetical protein
MGVMESHMSIATVICIYITPSPSPSRVHSEFTTLSIRWAGKIEKPAGSGGGGFDFIFLAGFTSRR